MRLEFDERGDTDFHAPCHRHAGCFIRLLAPFFVGVHTAGFLKRAIPSASFDALSNQY